MQIHPTLDHQSGQAKPSLKRRWDEEVARWVSHIASPPILALAGLLLIALTVNEPSGWIWAGYYSLLTIIIPILYVVWKVRRGEITDFYIFIRTQRVRPMLLTLACAVTAWVGFWIGNAPKLFILFGAMGIFQVLLLFAITLRWKISGHSAAIGSMAILLWGLYGAPALTSLLAIPLVAWSRVRLRRHTLLQTVAGSVAGVLLMGALLGIIFLTCHTPSLACVTPSQAGR